MKNKFVFGSKVNIHAHLNKKPIEYPNSDRQSLDEYVHSLDEELFIEKYKRIEAEEQGILIGVRNLKVWMVLEYGLDSYNPEKIIQSDYEYKTVYLVAISNRCIRKVYPEDVAIIDTD